MVEGEETSSMDGDMPGEKKCIAFTAVSE